MPNRVIKETITTSDTLASVSADAERLFWRLVVLADDYGRYDARPLIILGKGFAAMLGTLKPKDVERWLDELEGVRLIRRYTVEGHSYLVITTWSEHQQTRASRSKYPQPPADDGISPHLLASDSNGNQPLADVPVIENGNVNDNENVGAKSRPAPIPSSVSEVFDYYREKVQPNARMIDAARQKIKKRLDTFSVAQLKQGIDNFAADNWRMENNAHEGAAWFFHSDERSEKFLNLVPNSKASSNGKAEYQPAARKRVETE